MCLSSCFFFFLLKFLVLQNFTKNVKKFWGSNRFKGFFFFGIFLVNFITKAGSGSSNQSKTLNMSNFYNLRFFFINANFYESMFITHNKA